MQQSQRGEYNPALEYAIHEANEHGVPPIVVFGLTDGYPEANGRHYALVLEGLRETQVALAQRGVQMQVEYREPAAVALRYAHDACLLVTDCGYFWHQKQWRSQGAEQAACHVLHVEGDVVVPVSRVTDKDEYAARTIRPKIHRHLDRFLHLPETVSVRHPARGREFQDGRPMERGDAIIDQLDLGKSVPPARPPYQGGLAQAKSCLRSFLRRHLTGYDENRNQVQPSSVYEYVRALWARLSDLDRSADSGVCASTGRHQLVQ